MQALRQQVLRREKQKRRLKFHLACLAGNNIAICQNSTELAKELSRGSPSLIKKARKGSATNLKLGLAKKTNLFSVGVDLVDVTEEPSLERAGLSYGGF